MSECIAELTGTIPELLVAISRLDNFETRSIPSFEKQLKNMTEARENKVFAFQTAPIRLSYVTVKILPEGSTSPQGPT